MKNLYEILTPFTIQNLLISTLLNILFNLFLFSKEKLNMIILFCIL